MSYAQPPEAARNFATTVAPFIDEHTMVVLRVDMSRVPVEMVIKFLAIMVDELDTEEVAPTIRAWVKDFTRKGGRDVFLTYGPGDMPHLPVLLAPIGDSPKERKDLGELLKMPLGNDNMVIEHHHGCVAVGTKEALAHLKERKPAVRAELTEALNAGSTAIAQLAFTLTKDARKIHEQIAPFLPEDLGGGDIRLLTRGLKWGALTIDGGEKLTVKVLFETSDKETAQKYLQMQSKSSEVASKLFTEGDPDLAAALRRKLEALGKSTSAVTEANRLTTTVELGTAVNALSQMPETRLTADRQKSANSMKQIAIALHSYHDVNGHFPTDVRDKAGKALLSWRVHLLPYLEQQHLYLQFKMDEPWDSEANKKLIPLMPKVLRSPRQGAATKDRTTYLAPLGKGFISDAPKGLKFSEITDGSSNTIMVVEADDEQAVIWTKPDDLKIDAKNPSKGLLGHYMTGVHALLADGSVTFLPKSMPAADLWALFTRDGGEVIKFPK